MDYFLALRASDLYVAYLAQMKKKKEKEKCVCAKLQLRPGSCSFFPPPLSPSLSVFPTLFEQ